MPVVTAIAAVGALGYGIYSGERGQQVQKKALRRQDEAQKQAVAAAGEQQRRADMEQRAAHMKQPDIGELLAFEQGFGDLGKSSQQTTADPSRIRLGKSDLLGSP